MNNTSKHFKVHQRRSIVAIQNPFLRIPLALLFAPIALLIYGAVGLVRGLDDARGAIYGAILGEPKKYKNIH